MLYFALKFGFDTCFIEVNVLQMKESPLLIGKS